jgi:hypothetical protein
MAAGMVNAASGHVTDGLYAAELLDLLSGVVLCLAGVDDAAGRSVLAALWMVDPTGPYSGRELLG